MKTVAQTGRPPGTRSPPPPTRHRHRRQLLRRPQLPPKLLEINANSIYSRLERHNFLGLLRRGKCLSFLFYAPIPTRGLNCRRATHVMCPSLLEVRSDYVDPDLLPLLKSSNTTLLVIFWKAPRSRMDVPQSSPGWLSASFVMGQSPIVQSDCIGRFVSGYNAITTSRKHNSQQTVWVAGGTDRRRG